MNPVVHFEMPAKDRIRVKKFYEQVFGWTMTQLGSDMGDYLLATTTPTNEKTKRPLEPGAINGGFFSYNAEKIELQYPSVTIAVQDLKKAMEAVKNAGGTVVGGQKPGEPDDIPGVGLFIGIIDSEGNHVSLLQPTSMT